MPEQGAKAYMTELIARVIGLAHVRNVTMHFLDDVLEFQRIGPAISQRNAPVQIQVSARENPIPGHSPLRISAFTISLPLHGGGEWGITVWRHIASRVLEHFEQFIYFQDNRGYLYGTFFHLLDIRLGSDNFTISYNNTPGAHRRFRDIVDPSPYILPGDTYASSSGSSGAPARSHGWEPTPSYSYNPPHITRSAFGNPGKIQTGNSFSFRSSDFTGQTLTIDFKK